MAKIELGKYFTPKIIINLSIIFGFLILVSWLLITLSGEVRSKAESIQEQKLEIGARIKAISDLAELREESSRAKPAVAALNKALPTQDELVIFSRYLDSLARKDSVELGFNFLGEVIAPEGNNAGNIVFVIDLLGGYANILNFIEDLENGDFLITLESFNIALERNGFDVEMKGIIYFRG